MEQRATLAITLFIMFVLFCALHALGTAVMDHDSSAAQVTQTEVTNEEAVEGLQPAVLDQTPDAPLPDSAVLQPATGD